MDQDEDLDVAQLQNAIHDLVDSHDAISLFRALFSLENCQADGDDNVCPAPECEI